MPRLLRLLWGLIAIWLVYVMLFGEHNLLQLWRLERETAAMEKDLGTARAEIDVLRREAGDPKGRRRAAERILRSQGWAKEGEMIYREETVWHDSLGT